MSRQITMEIYKINELSESAKERAYNKYCAEDTYGYESDNKKVLDEFEKIFPIKVGKWEYGYHRYINFTFTGDDEVEDLSGIRLMKYIYNNYGDHLFKGRYISLWSKTEKSPNNPSVGKLKARYSKVMFNNDCVLTGYCIDMDILEPIYDFLKKPDSRIFGELIEECLESWVKACDEDYHNYYSMESFIDTSEANEWEYDEDGNII